MENIMDETSNDHQQGSLSLLISAHCSTIRRKKADIDVQELSALLNDVVRELNSIKFQSSIYLNSLNEVVLALKSTLPPSLISINSHYFFFLIRNTIQTLLQQLYKEYELNQLTLYVLRNCTLLLEHLVKKTSDVSKILHWITSDTFIHALADCLSQVKKISTTDESRLFIRQISRLLGIFADIQDRLPLHLHQNLFVRLFQPVVDCLKSSTYFESFKALKSHSKTFTAEQKLFLTECPHFITGYNGPNIEKTLEEVLKFMLPRYILIVNLHLKSIKNWQRPMQRAIYHLLTNLVFAEGYFTLNLDKGAFQTLIDHLLRLVNDSALIKQIRKIPKNTVSLLMDAALEVLTVLIDESDARDYIKQCKPNRIFRRLISTPCEVIVSKAYMLLAYTIDEKLMKNSPGHLSRLLTTTFILLHKAVESRLFTRGDAEMISNIDRNIIQLTETLRGLLQYDQVKQELFKQKALPYLVEYAQKLNGLSQQFVLDCLWTLSFDKEIADEIRKYSEFIYFLQNIQRPVVDDNQKNTLSRSNSRRNSALLLSNDATLEGIYQIAEGLLWNLIKKSEYRRQTPRNQKHTNDVMISYCYNDREIANKIQQMLVNEGFYVWSDHDILRRQVMESMAEAIDSSTLVILCISDSYKRDNHCQAEAEYAYNSKRIILPLIVRKGDEANDWLTSIVVRDTVIDFETNSALLIQKINQHCKKNISNGHSRTTTPNYIGLKTPRSTPGIAATPRSSVHTPISRSTTPGRISISSTPLPINGNYQQILPEEYTRRDTSNATYRSRSPNDWTNKDVLDFLYDLNLNLLMPLCETMSGRALIRFYRICHRKPSRVHNQLNDELRDRFPGLTLQMSVYTQFLIEMDSLLDTESDSSQESPFPPLTSKEYPMFEPNRTQSRASTVYTELTAPSPRSKSMVPLKTTAESRTSDKRQVVKRSVFRPASSIRRNYDFIVESDEEPTELLHQVERHADQILLLDAQARHYRERRTPQ